MIRISIEGQGETMNAAAQDMARQIALFLQQSSPEYQREEARRQEQQTVEQTGWEDAAPAELNPKPEPEPEVEENPDLSDMLAPETADEPEADEPEADEPEADEPEADEPEPEVEENPDLSDMLAPQAEAEGETVEEPQGPDPANILAFCVAYGKLHGGPKLKALLKRHQTARISQLKPERYEAFVRDARELAPDLAKAHKLG